MTNLSSINNIEIKIDNAKSVCPFCKNTGIVKVVSLMDDYGLPDGTYELSYLIERFGKYVHCCEGCVITN